MTSISLVRGSACAVWAAIGLLVGCGGGDQEEAAEETLRGDVFVEIDGDFVTALLALPPEEAEALLNEPYEEDCPFLTDEFADVENGEVVVRDEENRILGTARLQLGRMVARQGEGLGCELTFELAVPVVEFYEVTVGDDRGTETLSRAELDEADWEVHFSL
jgi:hypothetical protein